MHRTFTALFLALLAVTNTAGAANPVQVENAKPGTRDWQITNSGFASGVIEGYASPTSVNRGGRINLFVNTREPGYTLEIFRMGYYGGLGARRMTPPIQLAGIAQPMPAPDPVTGLIECNWTNPFVLDVPASADTTDWMSGVYLAKLTASSSGKQQYIMFTVRDDGRASDLLMAQTVNTYQAYNVWGGKSLYGTITVRDDTANSAHKVSLDRPYYGDEGHGASQFFYWEYPMIQWLEREGYDLTYAVNVDLDRDPRLLWTHKGYLSVGHDEYWSTSMRNNVEAARDRGVNLGFFSGNTGYWQTRYESSVATATPLRTIVCYKDGWRNDPITPDSLKTARYREVPVNRPEDALIGVLTISQARPPFVVEDASHWVFTGTGLHNGDVLLNTDGSPFLGYEIDQMGPASPANVRRLAHSPATAHEANFSDMTIYRAPSGATVFATGSIAWSQTVPQIEQITRNVLARFTTGAFTDAPAVRPALPSPLVAVDIGAVGRAGFVSRVGAGSFILNGAGKAAVDGQDALFYVYRTLSGDGEIVARLNALQLYWDNRAGVMIRESLAPSSRYAALLGRPSESRGTLLEGVDFRVKDQAAARPALVAARDLKLPDWLKLTRRGNAITAASSADGVTWVEMGTTTMALPPTVYIGTAVASARDGVWATASFDNVTIGGAQPAPDTTAPVVSITSPAGGAVVSGTVTLAASASDAVGVTNVQFLVDDVPLGTSCSSAPCSVAWDSRGVANGSHTLTAVARDAAGNTGTSQNAFVVSNGPLRRAVAADFDGDGRGDYAVFHPGSGVWSAPAQANQQWGLPGDIPVPGDYDGDGVLDRAVFRPASGNWFIKGQATIQWGRGGDVPVPADYDGDGKTDPAVFRTTDGAGAAWYIRGQPARAFGLRGDVPVPADYDGDGLADLAVYRPATGMWFIALSSTGYATVRTIQWGLSGDVPVPGDFDGDRRADPAVYRPATGTWYLLFSASAYATSAALQWGIPGDVPIAADFTGDGIDDLTVYRASDAAFWTYDRVTATGVTQQSGVPGDVPVAQRPRRPIAATADFDGDGRADVAVFRASSGAWFIRQSSADYAATRTITLGQSGDVAVAGDYDGDHKTDAAVYRPSTGTWLIKGSIGGFTTTRTIPWGMPGDLPVPADYDGDGRSDIAVFRPSTGDWYVRLSSSDFAAIFVSHWGSPGDIPQPADYDGDGRADLAVFRPSTGQWFLSLTTPTFGTTIVRQWGLGSDVPVAADYDGDGRAELAIYRPSGGQWLGIDAILGTQVVNRQWGLNGDVPLPFDFDGDGVADATVFRPSTAEWYVRRSSNGSFFSMQWGLPGSDRPALRQ